MMSKKTTLLSTLFILLLLVTAVPAALAAPGGQSEPEGQAYTVQADDWLSKLAEKFYGDPLAYPVIVEATNTAAQTDSSYATITDPDRIEVGWKLFIPTTAEAAMGMMESEESMMKSEEGTMESDQAMAEKTTFQVRLENVSSFDFSASGLFNTPVGASEPGALLPGGVYEVAFKAAPGDRLSFATMVVPSNDWFVGPDPAGLALFDAEGQPLSGDITAQLQLWDAGVEVNQEPGSGADQPLQQAAPNTGPADPNPAVRLVGADSGNLPAIPKMLNVSLETTGANSFVLRLENVSTESSLTTSAGDTMAVPFAPGVWVVHTGDNPLFTAGEPDRGQGLEALAEDGNPAELAAALAARTGLNTPLAPGVWAVHTTPDPLFTAGQPDRGEGLEALAEDGNPAELAATLANQSNLEASSLFNTPTGASEPGPLPPGSAYEFTVAAQPGDRLSLATMLVHSNDLFYSPEGDGLALFTPDGVPVSGDVTAQFLLWDAGTEVNQEPGFGPDQAPRQAGPDTGPAENGPVQPVSDSFSYPDPADVIRVTLSVVES